MTYLLDTNACIGWLRGSQPNLVARLQREQPGDVVICSVVVAELQYGVERSVTAHRANTALRVEQLRRQFVSLPSMTLRQSSTGGFVRNFPAKAILSVAMT